MKIPDSVSPVLKNIASANSLALEFWTSENGNRIMDCFFELAAGLAIAKLDLSPLPKGYGLVAVLFRWEHECQSEGWNAFEWMPNVEKISKSYLNVGLPEEAKAVSRAWLAWKKSGHDFDATNQAYNEVNHPYSIDLDRLEFLVDYFCVHANELFYESSSSADQPTSI